MTGDTVFRLSLACPAQPLGEAGSGGQVAHQPSDELATLAGKIAACPE